MTMCLQLYLLIYLFLLDTKVSKILNYLSVHGFPQAQNTPKPKLILERDPNGGAYDVDPLSPHFTPDLDPRFINPESAPGAGCSFCAKRLCMTAWNLPI